MPATYDSIASTVLGSPTSTYTFNSIPQTYTDLRLVFNGKCESPTGALALRFNGVTSSGSYVILQVRNSSGTVSQGLRTSDTFMYTLTGQNLPTTANYVGMSLIDIFNYANTSSYKGVYSFNGDLVATTPQYEISFVYGNFISTSAITSITVMNDNGSNFSTGTTMSLYGILRA